MVNSWREEIDRASRISDLLDAIHEEKLSREKVQPAKAVCWMCSLIEQQCFTCFPL